MAEPKTKDSTPGTSKISSRWPILAVTALLTAGVVFILTPTQLRFFLSLEDHRKTVIAHPEIRDFVNLDFLRELDRQLPPDARIFFSGMVGPNDHLAPYYFARSVLFPREVEISLDHKADFQIEGFRGVDCSDPYLLHTNGYDLALMVDKDLHTIAFPITKKGVLKR
jgi:hypothetical protein